MRIVTFLQSFGQGPVRPRTPPRRPEQAPAGETNGMHGRGRQRDWPLRQGCPAQGERREGTARGVPFFKMKCEDKP